MPAYNPFPHLIKHHLHSPSDNNPPSLPVEVAGVDKLLLAPPQSMGRDLPNWTVYLSGADRKSQGRNNLTYMNLDPTGPESAHLGIPDYVSLNQLELDFLPLTVDGVLTITNSFRIYLFGSFSRKTFL